jgi:hypothetical protein
VCDTEQVVIPRQAEAFGDLGYQGSDRLTIPEKKPKGKPLPEEAKVYTGRAHASLRILVEHVIGKVKIFNAQDF